MIFFSYGNFLMAIKLFQLHLLVCLSRSPLQCLIYLILKTHLHFSLFLGCLEIPLIKSISTNILHKEVVDFRSCGSILLIYLFMFGLLLSYYLTILLYCNKTVQLVGVLCFRIILATSWPFVLPYAIYNQFIHFSENAY